MYVTVILLPQLIHPAHYDSMSATPRGRWAVPLCRCPVLGSHAGGPIPNDLQGQHGHMVQPFSPLPSSVPKTLFLYVCV